MYILTRIVNGVNLWAVVVTSEGERVKTALLFKRGALTALSTRPSILADYALGFSIPVLAYEIMAITDKSYDHNTLRSRFRTALVTSSSFFSAPSVSPIIYTANIATEKPFYPTIIPSLASFRS